MIEYDGMKYLPRQWVHATIGELVSTDGIFNDGDWVESKDQDPKGDIRLIQLADVGDGLYRNRSARFLTSQKAQELNCTFLATGDVLIARMPDPLGRACVFPGDSKGAVTVVDVCIVRLGSERVNNKWLMFAVNSPQFRAEIAKLQSGSTRKRISRGNLATLVLPVPPSKEQRRMADKIEELFTKLDAGIEELTKVQKQIKRFRQVVLRDAVTGQLTKAWREENKADLERADYFLKRILTERREQWEKEQFQKFKESGNIPLNDFWKKKYKEPKAPDTENLPELPEDWTWINLDTVLTKIEAGKSFRCNERPPQIGEVGIVKVSAVTWGTFNELESKTPLNGNLVNERFLITAGDFLFSRANTIDLVGTCVIVRSFSRQLMLSDKILRFRFIILSSEFLLNLLRSEMGRSEIKRLATGNQDSMRNIGQDRIREIRIPLPPLSEQKEIVNEVERLLSVADAIEETVRQSLKQATRLRQSILKLAFDGRLVPQDPSDEPAEILLERIKEEKEARQKELKGKGRKSRPRRAKAS